jgi:hypothetical protein
MPPKKPQTAVCVGVIDVGEAYGIQPDQDGIRWVPSTNPAHPEAKQKVRFIFESSELMEDSRPFRLSRQFNVTMSDQGFLKPFLDGWGVELVRTDAGIDLEASCVGKCAMVNVVHEPDKRDPEKLWANISTVMPTDVVLTPTGEFDKGQYLKTAQENHTVRESDITP